MIKLAKSQKFMSLCYVLLYEKRLELCTYFGDEDW